MAKKKAKVFRKTVAKSTPGLSNVEVALCVSPECSRRVWRKHMSDLEGLFGSSIRLCGVSMGRGVAPPMSWRKVAEDGEGCVGRDGRIMESLRERSLKC